MRLSHAVISTVAVLLASALAAAQEGTAKNLLTNPSFEDLSDNDKVQPFLGWYFHVWEGDGRASSSPIGHDGKKSALLMGTGAPKMRLQQFVDLEPGRYRVTAFLRGFDLGKGTWGASTEFMFDAQEDKVGKGKYHALGKEGTFGWTKMTFVGDIDTKRKVTVSFGSWSPGFFWVADAKLEKVGNDVELTAKPVLDKEEAPIKPPGKLDGNAIHCPRCSARNMPAWKICYVCGADLSAKKATATAPAFTGPAVRLITDFTGRNPFNVLDSDTPAPIVDFPGGQGIKAMRHDKSYNVMAGNQNWTGYDYLKLDVYTEAKDGMAFTLEFYDAGSVDYWTRARYNTIIPPGTSTLLVPLKQVYLGEKSRPGRALDISNIRKVAVIIDEKPAVPVLISNIRLERAPATEDAHFDGLFAFDFQSDASSPVMDGFTPVFPTNNYTDIKGYGLKDAKTSPQSNPRIYEPDPLYGDYFRITGPFVMDVPNGKYRVFVNVNRAPAFWGELQNWTKRTILANGKPVVTETYDDAAKKKRFFQHWNEDDLPTDSTFGKYENSYEEKVFDAEVTDGQLAIDFQGDFDANCISAMVVFPLDKLPQGEKFLKWMVEQRRFQFDLNHKRGLHRPTGDALSPTDADKKRGYVVFTRDIMKDVFYNDTPFAAELGKPVAADAFAGELAPMTVAIVPLKDLGKVTVSISDLSCEGGTIPAAAVDAGYVSYRMARVTSEGSVFTIVPRYIMPWASVEMPKDITRRFWLTAKVPADAKAGVYKGKFTVKAEKGEQAEVPVELRIRAGALDALDIPAGPWGYQVPYADDLTCLKRIREYGFTIFSSGQAVNYGGFKDGKPVLNFTAADKLMATAKELGFQAVMFYGTLVSGINAYAQDAGAMSRAGFKDYSEFIKAVYTDIQKHAEEKGWPAYYVNLGDEPMGQALTNSAVNAEAYRKAFPKGPPFFTAATSVADVAKDAGHFRLAKALHIADLNLHSESSVKAIHDAGSEWAFYNGGNRWTFGDYMYKAAKEFGMKFRISWHWNLTGGYPYYALDAREDEYCWCNGSPDGTLIPSVEFEHQREGLGDYRRLLTLARLAKDKAGTPAAGAAEKLIADRMASFKLGQRDHDALFGADDWAQFRVKVNDAIDAMRK